MITLISSYTPISRRAKLIRSLVRSPRESGVLSFSWKCGRDYFPVFRGFPLLISKLHPILPTHTASGNAHTRDRPSWAIPLCGGGQQRHPTRYRLYSSSSGSLTNLLRVLILIPQTSWGPESLFTCLYMETSLCPTPLTSLSPGLAFPPLCTPAFEPAFPSHTG